MDLLMLGENPVLENHQKDLKICIGAKLPEATS